MQMNKGEGGLCKIGGHGITLGHLAGCSDVEKGEGVLEMMFWKGRINEEREKGIS